MDKLSNGGPVVCPSSDSSKSKYRAKQSCIPCRTRKVKCDRIKPCQACCVRGLPSECEYLTNNEDRHLISQADAIESLRSEVGRLKQRLADLEGSSNAEVASKLKTNQFDSLTQSISHLSSEGSHTAPHDSVGHRNYTALQALVQVIAHAPPHIVADAVAQVRNGAALENVVAWAERESKLSRETAEGRGHSAADSERARTVVPRDQALLRFDDLELRPPKKSRQETGHGNAADKKEDGETFAAFSVRSPQHADNRDIPLQTLNEMTDLTSPREADDKQEAITQSETGLAECASVVPHCSRKRPRSPDFLRVMISERPATRELFLERFIDVFSPRCDLIGGTSECLRAAAGIRMFSPLLCDAFQATATTFFGLSVLDRRIETSGYRDYLTVLHGLQQALYNPEHSKSQGVLLTVAVLMCFESLQHTASGSLIKHTLGALKLIEYRGPENHVYGVEHLSFTEYRHYWVGMALVTRAPTFLAREEWKIIPWSSGSSVKDILHHLLDQVADIPAFLAQFDKFTEGLSSGCMPSSEVVPTQTKLWNWVADLDHRLRKWKRDWADNYPDGQIKEVSTQGADPFPVFRCRNLATMEIITPKTLEYPDLRLAHTMCFYYAAHLILSAADTRPTGGIQPAEQYEFACNICRSVEYFVRFIPGALINRLVFPLRVAYDMLPEGNVEREFVKEIFQLVTRRNQLKSWASMIPEISAKRKTTR